MATANQVMSYQEWVSSRPLRHAALAAIPRCAGCRCTFESYGMTVEQGFAVEGKVYCNADCHGSAEVEAAELADYASLSENWS